jgi:hypothetical protein
MGGRQRGVGVVFAVAGVLGLAAIVPATDGLAAATRAASVPKALVGCWHRHVAASPVGTSAGIWSIAIKKGGTLAAYPPGTMTPCGAYADFTATVSVTGNRLTIGRVPVCATKGVYSWRASGNSLTLHATADKACSARALLFTGVWKRK